MNQDARFWDRSAERYARRPVADPACFERKIQATTALMRPGHVVLDIGCGTGSLALRLAPHVAEVHGLDVSREMIRIARGKAQAQGAGKVRFHVGSFDDGFDAFGPESLDGICAYSLLHLLPDRHAALERIHRLLKPGGFFVSSTVCLRESRVPYAPIIAVMRLLRMAPTVTSFDRATLERDMREAGFVDIARPQVGAGPMIAFLVARRG